MIEYTCCFTGHRPVKLPFKIKDDDEQYQKLKSVLINEIVRLITEEGITHFISGMAIGVDTICAEIILDLKAEYQITLECAIPCRNQDEKWNEQQKIVYNQILMQANTVTYLQNDYSRGCMQRRNKYMVDKSLYVIAVWNGEKSGTKNTVTYAQKKKRKIKIIDPNNL